MKLLKLAAIPFLSIYLVSCGGGGENENSVANTDVIQLGAYFNNNEFSEISTYAWSDSIAVYSNDEYILNQLYMDGHFTGAEDYYQELISLFNELHYDERLIVEEEYYSAINKIVERSGIDYIFIPVKLKSSPNLKFEVYPILDNKTGGYAYYPKELENLVKKFNTKIAENNITKEDTLIPEMVGDESSIPPGELIGSLEIKGNKGFTKRETRKGVDDNGVEFTADVDVYYTGERKTESKLVGAYMTSDMGIIIVDDVNYLPSNKVRPRIRKFNEYGFLQWTFCVQSCDNNVPLGVFDDLSYYNMIQIGDTLSISLLENDFMFTFYGYGNGGEINSSKYKEFELNLKVSNGQLISFKEVSTDESIAKSKWLPDYIRENQILMDYTLATSQNVFSSKGSAGEKFQFGTIKNMMSTSNDEIVEMDINFGINILGEKFHYLRQHKGNEENNFRFFYIPDGYSECNCEND